MSVSVKKPVAWLLLVFTLPTAEMTLANEHEEYPFRLDASFLLQSAGDQLRN